MKLLMDKPVDLLIKELRENIYNTVNNSGLPLCISFLVVKDIFNDLEETSIKTSNKKIEEYYKSIQPVDQNNIMNIINGIAGDPNS